MIRGLWYQQDEAIIDIKLSNADADYYKYDPMSELLTRREIIKKYKHSKYCHDQQKHSPPFYLSIDGMLGRKYLVVLAQLSQTMADKMGKPILSVWGWINGQFAIMVLRSYSCMIHRDQLPSPLQERDPA